MTKRTYQPTISNHLGLPIASSRARLALRQSDEQSRPTLPEHVRSRAEAAPILTAITKRSLELAQADSSQTYATWDDITASFLTSSLEATEQVVLQDHAYRDNCINVLQAFDPFSYWGRVDRYRKRNTSKTGRKLVHEFQKVVAEAVVEGVATTVATQEVIPRVVALDDPDTPEEVGIKRSEAVIRSSVGFVLDWAALGKEHDAPLARQLSVANQTGDPFYELRFRPEAFELSPKTSQSGQIVGETVSLTTDQRHSALHLSSLGAFETELFGCPVQQNVVQLYRFVTRAAMESGLVEQTFREARENVA